MPESQKAAQNTPKPLQVPQQGAQKNGRSRNQPTARCRQKPLPSLPLGEAEDQVAFTYLNVSESSYIAFNLLNDLCKLNANHNPQTNHGFPVE